MNYRAMMATAVLASCLIGTQAFAQAEGVPKAPVAGVGAPSNRNSMTGLEQRMNIEKLFEDPAAASKVYDHSVLIARCVVKLSGEKASTLLGGPGTSDPRFTKLSNAMTGRYASCLRGESAKSLSPALLTSAIAEELIHRAGGTAEDRASNVNVDKATAFHGDLQGAITIVNIARCTVVYSPGLAHKVLATKTGSPEELAALGTLYSRTPECGMSIVPTSVGQTFQRSAIADALYAWTQQNSGK